jgi:1-acyl-sn-glycerol-3-phosphate acyltransferase
MSRISRLIESCVDLLIALFSRISLALYVDLRVEGREHLPPTGGVIIASRHYHFVFDALALERITRRPSHFWTALDWTSAAWQRLGMELLCRAARWPIMLRVDQYSLDRFARGESAYRLEEAHPLLRVATQQAVALLRSGETLVIFPEAYTSVDIFPTPKDDGRSFMPFRPGFVKLAQLAERGEGVHVSIVPAGFSYERLTSPRRPVWRFSRHKMWRVTLRLGEPTSIAARATPAEVAALVAQVERAVHALSAPISRELAASMEAVEASPERNARHG